MGALGSAVVIVREKEARALLAAIKELPSEFRRCWYHQPAGIAALMATSIRHELSAVDANDLVKVFCHTAGLAFVALGSTTAQSEDRCYSVDPDESFLIGERATRFLRIESTDGQEAAIADLGAQPQDLAVEVERGISQVGILVPLDAAALDALQRWAERTSAGSARRMTTLEATAAAIQAALSSTAHLRLVGGTDTEEMST